MASLATERSCTSLSELFELSLAMLLAAMLATPGYPVNAPNAHGDTALMFACALGDVELVEALLAKGADPLARAASGVWEGLDARAVADPLR